MRNHSDPRLILLHDSDNGFVCVKSIAAGETINMDGDSITLTTGIEIGHKIARSDIRAGDKILKYGVSIGSATSRIQRGEHMHMHNVKSDYLPSHTRGGKSNEIAMAVEIKQ